VLFHRTGLLGTQLSPITETVTFDGTLQPDDPTPSVEGESWTILYFRALKQLDTKKLIRDEPGESLLTLTGRFPDVHNRLLVDFNGNDVVNVQNAVGANKPVVVRTKGNASNLSTNLLIPNRTYTVLGFQVVNGQVVMQLRDPQGVDTGAPSGSPSDG